jgi:ribosomal-protein-alanine N-acetyltransferase
MQFVDIRKVDTRDAPEIFELAKDENLVKFLSWEAHKTIENTRNFIKLSLAEWQLKKSCVFCVEQKKDHKIVGMVSLIRLDWKDSKAEIGIWIGTPYQGLGYNYEAVKLIVKYGFETLHLNRLCSRVALKNIKSYKTFENLGFVKEGILREDVNKKGKFLDMQLFSILKKEYKKTKELKI